MGFEPLTPTLPVLCAPNCANAPPVYDNIFKRRCQVLFVIIFIFANKAGKRMDCQKSLDIIGEMFYNDVINHKGELYSMNVELISYTPNPVEAIERAASTCYDSMPTGGKIMRHCYKSGHHSVLEFADFSFKITGVSRALTHQLVRHRMASYAQRSQRYCTEDGFEFVTPRSIVKDEEALARYNETMETIQMAYEELLARGVPAEDARMLLPNACCTQICVKMNLRALIHFCNERLCTCAQWEIREMARGMVKAVVAVEPALAEFLVPKCEAHAPHSFCTESKSRTCGRHPLIGDIVNHESNT